MPRFDGRQHDELRKVTFDTEFTESDNASVLTRFGKTMVWTATSVVEIQPQWMKNDPDADERGWVTAEYNMLPASTTPRSEREGRRRSLSGRTQEIQRLIGRSLRAVVDLKSLGPRTITVDCEVLQADGGTRCACITGAYVALAITLHRLVARKLLQKVPLKDSVAAVSCGLLRQMSLLDLPYREDVDAGVDMNIVMTGSLQFVEIQGTGESQTFNHHDLNQMIQLAEKGITELTTLQNQAISHALQRLGIKI